MVLTPQIVISHLVMTNGVGISQKKNMKIFDDVQILWNDPYIYYIIYIGYIGYIGYRIYIYRIYIYIYMGKSLKSCTSQCPGFLRPPIFSIGFSPNWVSLVLFIVIIWLI